MTPRTAVIIVAGGSGLRMGGALPKQFLTIGGKPILMHTILRFTRTLEGCRVVLVLPRSHVEYWQSLCQDYGFTEPHAICVGGETRFESVRNGLECVGDAELVAVHDGVRPLVSGEVILRAVEDARVFGAVIPVVTPVDSLREIREDGSHVVDRSTYRIVQTPQVFKSKILRKAYEQPYQESFTDDASVVEASGSRVYLCEGAYSNIKITTPIDLITAEALLEE